MCAEGREGEQGMDSLDGGGSAALGEIWLRTRKRKGENAGAHQIAQKKC